MQSIEMSDLDRLLSDWEKLLRDFPVLKETFLEQAGQRVKQEVDETIRGAGMKNQGGPLPGWQTYHVGSGLGYIAVRAKGWREGATTGDNSPGAITNYTENGHRIRKPDVVHRKGYRYRKRINEPAVRGFHYYANVRASDIKDQIGAMGEEFMQKIARRLEGNES